MKSHNFVLTVDNEPGVLARITSVLHRYSINIDQLIVNASVNDPITRIEMDLSISEEAIALIVKRLGNLYNVHQAQSSTAQPTMTSNRRRNDAGNDLPR